MPDYRRSDRVTVRVREELARLLRQDLDDPRLVHGFITRVVMPDDLQSARVYVRLEVGGDEPAIRQALLAGLLAAAGKLRREVGRALHLRRTPTLEFFYDEQLDDTLRIEGLLAEIADERKSDE